MNEKSKKTWNWRPWLAAGIAIALSLGLCILRIEIFPEKPEALAIAGLCLVGILALLAAVNVIYHLRYEKQNRELTLRNYHEEMERRKESMERSYARQTRRISSLLKGAYLYYALVMAMVLGALFCLFDGGNYLLLVYMLWGLVGMLLEREDQELPPCELDRVEFPLLHETARQAADAVGYEGNIRIFIGNEGLGIFSLQGSENLVLGIPETFLLTREELKQALIHEFAHVVQADTAQSLRFNRELARWDASKGSILTIWGTVFLWIPQDILRREFAFYQNLSTIYREQQADETVVKVGSPQEHINGLAKGYTWAMFFEHPLREVSYDLFAMETPCPNYYSFLVELYQKYLAQKEDHWRAILARELESKFDSHPIFRVRMKNAGITEYDLHTVEPDPAFAAELTKFCKHCDALALKGYPQEDYDRDRQTEYFERKELIDEAYAVTDFDEVSVERRLDYAMALAVVDPEKQKTVLNSILAQEPENNYAVWLLAQALYREDDEDCVELLYKAAQLNNNYVQSAFSCIANYAVRAGREDIREAYREQILDQVQQSVELDDELGRLDSKDRLSRNDLPEKAQVDAAVFQRGGEHLDHVYTVRKETSDGPAYYYLLEFAASADAQTRERVYQDIFLYLDQREEHFCLFVLEEKDKLKKLILKRVPDCEIER